MKEEEEERMVGEGGGGGGEEERGEEERMVGEGGGGGGEEEGGRRREETAAIYTCHIGLCQSYEIVWQDLRDSAHFCAHHLQSGQRANQ